MISRMRRGWSAVFDAATVILWLMGSAAALAQGPSAPLPPLSKEELAAVIGEIEQMVRTPERAANDFVVRDATPDRIERLYGMPELAQQPKNVRENGLIFAGSGRLLAFDKPSDVVDKMAAWFPQEVGASRAKGDWDFPVFLHGPFLRWEAEPMAFMGLWHCMPGIAWATPGGDPFEAVSLRPNGRRSRDDMSSVRGRNDFGACIREDLGYRQGTTAEGRPAADEMRQQGDRAAALLGHKFARFLQAQGCRGTGPDDCLMVLHLWAQLSPQDPRLASSLQTLAPLQPPDGPETSSGSPLGLLANKGVDAGQRQTTALLREAVFLRAQIVSITAQPSAWPKGALTKTLRRLTRWQERLVEPGDKHLRRRDPLPYHMGDFSPWVLLRALSQQSPAIRQAIAAEIDRIEGVDPTHCAVRERWWADDAGLYNSWALRHLGDTARSDCTKPNWEWIKKGTTDEAIELREKALEMIERTRDGTLREWILSAITAQGEDCFPNQGGPTADWQAEVCRHWIHEPPLVPLSVAKGRLKLNEAPRFRSVRWQASDNAIDSLDQKKWADLLTAGMHRGAKARMKAHAAGLRREKRRLRSAAVWRHPSHPASLFELEVADNNGTKVYVVLTRDALREIAVPERFLRVQYAPQEIVRVSDLDADGHLEVWWAHGFDRCDDNASDMKRAWDCSANEALMGEVSGNTLSYFTLKPGADKRRRAAGAGTPARALSSGGSGPDGQRTPCNRALIGSYLADALDLDFGVGGSRYESDLIDLICRPDPMNPSRLQVALFHNLPDAQESDGLAARGWAVAVFDVAANRVLAVQRGHIEEDASLRVQDGTLDFDARTFPIAPGLDAFGLHMHIGYSPRYAEGGESDYLTLFVMQGSNLRPILERMALFTWERRGDLTPCSLFEEPTCPIENRQGHIELAQTSTNGWRDLSLVTTTSLDTSRKKSTRATTRLRMKDGTYQR